MADLSNLETIKASDKPIEDDFSYIYAESANKAFIRIAKEELKKLILDGEYTNEEIDQKISTIPKFNTKVVSSLPTTDISETTVYLVSSGDDSENLYTEYININGLWEILGTQKSTFSGSAKDVTYDDTETNLGATDVQGAIGKLSATLNNLSVSGLTTEQVNSLHEMFKVVAFDSSKDYASAYSNFLTAFGLSINAEYTVTNNLTNITTSNANLGLIEGDEYTTILTVNDGYVLSNITVTMGGVDVTSTVWNSDTNSISISNVTGDIVITASAVEATITMYTVTNNLTNVTTDNDSISVEEGSYYVANLTIEYLYTYDTVTVTMGGVDVTSTVYVDGVITISSVTGDIVITASATQKETNEPIYTLPSATTFSGSDDEIINTGVTDLLTTDNSKSFSVVIDVEVPSSNDWSEKWIYECADTKLSMMATGGSGRTRLYWQKGLVTPYTSNERTKSVFTFDSAKATAIIHTLGDDGAVTETSVSPATTMNSTGTFYIGGHSTTSGMAFAGTIYDLKIYERVLTASEISSYLEVA